jgi:excisionase family DNA binding protein
MRHANRHPESQLLSISAASAVSGIAPGSLRRLIAAKHLPAVELPGVRRVLIDRADLAALIESAKR